MHSSLLIHRETGDDMRKQTGERIQTKSRARKEKQTGLTEVFSWISRAPFALPKGVPAFFVLQKLLHLDFRKASGLLAP